MNSFFRKKEEGIFQFEKIAESRNKFEIKNVMNCTSLLNNSQTFHEIKRPRGERNWLQCLEINTPS